MNGVEDEVACPKCSATDLERQLPRVAIQFKGSGYYKTDRANKRSKAGTKGSSDASPTTNGESTTSADTKAEKPAKSSDSA